MEHQDVAIISLQIILGLWCVAMHLITPNNITALLSYVFGWIGFV